jgi:hypothetical protein
VTSRNARRAVNAHRRQRDQHPTVDLSDHLDIDTFDQTLRALEGAVDASQDLALDSQRDRRTLVRRLWRSIGTVA